MAFSRRNTEEVVAQQFINITDTEAVENYTVYVIEVQVGSHRWSVRHRYSEFNTLHEKLVSQKHATKDLLPPKKFFGSQSESFVRKRKQELETYLRTLLQRHPMCAMPQALALFLDIKNYDIHGITQSLAEELFLKGDLILQAGETFHITPLQLYAISSRLRLPEPTCESGDTKRDIGHILDFTTNLKYLKINGTNGKIGSSNIESEQLSFDLSFFRSLEVLEIKNINSQMATGIDNIRKTLKALHVHDSVDSIKEVLLMDVLYWESEDDTSLLPTWNNLTSLDFSHNNISSVDQSIKLAADVAYLDLSYNVITCVDNLHTLTSLSHLDLSHNGLSVLPPLHTRLGNVKSLNLSSNKIDSLEAISKLYSLERLDVSHNEISEAVEVKHISSLPCLENLILIGNPVTFVVDYRTRILELFRERAPELCLDHRHPCQKEIDTVSILLAIQKSRSIKDRSKGAASKKHVHVVEANIAESQDAEIGPTPKAPGEESRTSETASVTSDPDGFRGQLEMLREREGAGWLSALNKLHQSEEEKKFSSNKHVMNEEDYYVSNANVEPINLLVPFSTSSAPEAQPLPGITDSAFMQYIQQLIPVSSALGVSQQPSEELPQLMVWCPCLSYTRPNEEWSACLFLTNSAIHILEVQEFPSYWPAGGVQDSQQGAPPGIMTSGGEERNYNMDEFPILSHVYSMTQINVQQVLVGVGSLMLRIEEAFTGPQGTFSLLIGDSATAQRILQYICLSGDIHIHHTEVGDVRRDLDLGEAPLEMYSLVFYENKSKNCTGTHSVVLTESELLIVREDYIHWPETTFSIESPTHSRYHRDFQYPYSMYKFQCEIFNGCACSDSDVQNLYQFCVKVKMEGKEKKPEHQMVIAFLHKESRENFLITLDQLTLSRTSKDKSASIKLAEEENLKILNDKKDDFLKNCDDNDGKNTQIQTEKVIEYTSKDYYAVKNASSEIKSALQPLQQHTEPSGGHLADTLLIHLKDCLARKQLLHPLSESLNSLSLLSAEELINYFHSSVVEIGTEKEELHHVVWTAVIPYTCPTKEIPSLVMVSSRAVYFLSDYTLKQKARVPVWRTHARHQSDSMIKQRVQNMRGHHTSGILHTVDQARPGVVRVYATLPLADLCQVNVGLFEQALRLVGDSEDTCFTCVTRDLSVTETFTYKLMSVLSLMELTKSGELTPNDKELDFYETFSRQDSCEVVHSSQVTFIYPNEEMISDLGLIISQSVSQTEPHMRNTNILLYSLVIQAPHTTCNSSQSSPPNLTTNDLSKGHSRTLILTSTHICMAQEDLVTFPLPHFVKGLPENEHFVVKEVRNLEYLKRIVLSDFNSRDVSLVFSDQTDDVIVDPMMDYYSKQSGKTSGADTLPEVTLTVFLQTAKDKNRLIKVVGQRWAELNDGCQLSVQVST